MTKHLRTLTVVVLGLCGGAANADELTPPKRWETFTLDELREQREATSGPWLAFLKVPALSTGLYVLPAGGQDRQTPHERDEVYYVVSGRAVLEVDGERQPVSAGSVVYVKAKIDHRFVEIEEELEVLVVFAAAPTEGAAAE